MITFKDKNGNLVQRHDRKSYTVKDLKEILSYANDNEEVLVCVAQATNQDEQMFPNKERGSIYFDKDLLIIEVNNDSRDSR